MEFVRCRVGYYRRIIRGKGYSFFYKINNSESSYMLPKGQSFQGMEFVPFVERDLRSLMRRGKTCNPINNTALHDSEKICA